MDVAQAEQKVAKMVVMMVVKMGEKMVA